ncbi:MAG: DUF6039 family protein [Syntrophorhabdales bacterium]|jgi:hypothetical protein
MVRWTRSGRIAPGKDQQAIQWAKEITEYINKKYSGHLSVYMDCFGELGTVRWFEDFENLAAVEKRMQQVMADQEYWQRVSQAPTLFQGVVFDTAMATL